MGGEGVTVKADRARVAKDAFALEEEFDGFDLLTDEEQHEYLALLEQAVGPRWVLSPKQQFAEILWGKIDWLLWGGAAGGGKSEFAVWHANRLSEEIDGHATLLMRQSIPELRRSLIIRLIARARQFGIDLKYRKVDGQSAFHYGNGSIIEAGFLKTDENLGNYLSAEYGCIIIDEATQVWPDQIKQMAGRLRVTKEAELRGARPHLGLFTNPGDVGHAWCLDLFITPCEYGNRVVVFNIANGLEADERFMVRSYDLPTWERADGSLGAMSTATPDEIDEHLLPWVETVDIEVDAENELAVAFVPARAQDNPYLAKSTMKMLNALPPLRRAQLRDGDWDTFAGQFFDDWKRELHVVPAFQPPASWTKVRCVDWGGSAPWCMLWLAWDEDGDCYVYREAYGPGLSPKQQAMEAQDRSVVHQLGELPIRERYAASVSDPAVFADRKGTGKSIADMWRDAGLTVTRARNDRRAGWANVKQYLWDPSRPAPDGSRVGWPRLFIADCCPNLIRTIPLMQRSKNDPEDMDTALEDHACVAKGTLVETSRGPVPIEDVRVGDKVLTRNGMRRVEWSGVSGVRPLFRVEVGQWSLDCTADHPIWTEEHGWVEAAKLTSDMTIRLLSPQPSRRSPARRIGSAASTSSATVSAFIAACGRWRMAPFLGASMSTTSTSVAATTGWPTSSSSSAATTCQATAGRAPLPGSLRSEGALLGSLLATLDSRASNDRPPLAAGGSSRPWPRSRAKRVVRPWPPRSRPAPSTAGPTVVRLLCASVEVHNLVVQGAHEFYANGALVHNCDALRYGLAWRPLSIREKVQKVGLDLNGRFKQQMAKAGKIRPAWMQ